MKKSIVFLIVLILIIMLILVFILMNILNQNKVDEFILDENNIDFSLTTNKQDNNVFSEVKDVNEYFMINSILDNYIYVLSYQINLDDSIDENPYQIRSEEDRKNVIFNILNEKYKEKNNIVSKDDIKIENIAPNTSVIPIEMRYINSNNIYTYAFHVYIGNEESKAVEEKFYIISIDKEKEAFSIQEVSDVKSIEEIDYKEDLNSIEQNEYNYYTTYNLNDESLSKIYFQKLKYLAINFPELFYNKYMDNEYSNKRFGGIEEFQKFIEESREELENTICMKYLVTEEEGYAQNGIKEYVVQDQFDNYYIIDTTEIMKFNAKFDTYTISVKNFSDTYKSSNNKKRVQMNVDKFIQMLNRHDYRTSFKYLADSFKNNYSLTEDGFKDLVKSKFFKYNNFEFISIDEISESTYTCKVRLSDKTEENTDNKEITIIMRLNEDEDFELSF